MPAVKKHRICTTISEKHWRQLNRQKENFESQQKVLEHALDSLEYNQKPGAPPAPEDEFRQRVGLEIKTSCIIQREALKMLLETMDLEQFKEFTARQKPIEYSLEYLYQKPLNECSMKEIVDGVITLALMTRWFDTAVCSDKGDHYMLKLTHDIGINNSKTFLIAHESLFSTCGVRTESKISERTIFVKIFKKL